MNKMSMLIWGVLSIIIYSCMGYAVIGVLTEDGYITCDRKTALMAIWPLVFGFFLGKWSVEIIRMYWDN